MSSICVTSGASSSASTFASTFITVRAGMSSTIRCGCSVSSTRLRGNASVVLDRDRTGLGGVRLRREDIDRGVSDETTGLVPG